MPQKLLPERNQREQGGGKFREILRDHWDEFKIEYPYYDNAQYEEPVQKMLGCGSELGGYSEYLCTHCGHGYRRVLFTCKGSFCLSCSKKYADNFVSQVSGMLHPGVGYQHIILTMPEQLRPKFYENRHDGKLLSTFMGCGYECLEDIMSTAKKRKIKIGCIVVVHTAGRSGIYNPHLHIIMTKGGIDTDTKGWIDFGYIDYGFIRRKWQFHLLNMVKSYFGSDVDQLTDELSKKYDGFVFYLVQNGIAGECRNIAVYLAKYLASPPISNRRIVAYDGKKVEYLYKDHEEEEEVTETLDALEFIDRMVQHIKPKGLQRVRYFGLQATKTFKKWSEVIQNAIRKSRYMVKYDYKIVRKKNFRERYKEGTGRDPLICRCGSEMKLCRIHISCCGNVYDIYPIPSGLNSPQPAAG